MQRWVFCVVLVCAACVFACAGDDAPAMAVSDDGGSPGGSDAAPVGDAEIDAQTDQSDGAAGDCGPVMEDILVTCGNIVCHDPFSGGIGTQLDLSDREALPDSLVGQISSPECGSLPYIDAERPERSLVLRKLDDDPPCGERMPAGDRPPLDAEQRTCFLAWVQAAAAR